MSVTGAGGSPVLISVHCGVGKVFPPPPRLKVTNTPASVATYNVCAGWFTIVRTGPPGKTNGPPAVGGLMVTVSGGSDVGSITTAFTDTFGKLVRMEFQVEPMVVDCNRSPRT